VSKICFHILPYLFISSQLYSLPAQAQLRPDQSLGSESSIIQSQQNSGQPDLNLIIGGAQRGGTLFHSFQEFNVGQGQRLYFANPAHVRQIVTRVTGSQTTEILGQLGVLGKANLYLLNPNGFVFGPDASLNLQGSLVISTARSAQFGNQFIYNTSNPQLPPLLNFDAPTALNFNLSPGTILVQGSGGEVLQGSSNFLPVTNFLLPVGLAVTEGQTLAFIGGQVTLRGGVLSAPSGTIELVGISQGQVKINDLGINGLSFSYPTSNSLQNVLLEQKSILNASGNRGGQIKLIGENITFLDNSLAFINHFGPSPAGQINLQADNDIRIVGNTPLSSQLPSGSIFRFSGILSQALNGEGASIFLSSKNIFFQESATIFSSSFGTGRSGAIRIQAKDLLSITSLTPLISQVQVGSVIVTSSNGSGGSGNVSVNSTFIEMSGASTLATSTNGLSRGGNLTIITSKGILLDGFNSSSLFPTVISTSTLGGSQGGNLSIITGDLQLQNGANINASALGNGQAGNMVINANSITVDGNVPGGLNPTQIISSANRIDPSLTRLVGVNLGERAASGSILINSNDVTIRNGAEVTVRNDTSFGNAGSLTINTNNLSVLSGGKVTAGTNGGDRGRMSLNVGRLFFLNSGIISSTASGKGNGGDISITTPLLAARDSLITANAQQASGGRVEINAQGLFLDRNTVISASSGLGPEFNGPVRIESQTQEIIQPTQPEIALAQPVLEVICQPTGSNSLTIQAFGGAIVSPTQSQSSQPSWGKTTTNPTGKLSQQHAHNQAAVSWRNNPDGTVDFINATQYIQDVRQGVCGKPTP
jgi:filamentous hemagglutinin family protein